MEKIKNRYSVTFFTKTKRIINTEMLSELKIKDFIDYIMECISRGDSLSIDTSINSENKYEVLLKGNIEGFEVTQY